MKHTYTLKEIMEGLELDPSIFPLKPNMGFEEASKKLIVFKEIIKKQRKLLAKKYHPDKPGNIGKEDKMKKVNNLSDMVLNMQIEIKQPKVFQRIYVYRHQYSYTHTRNNAGTSSTTGW